MAKERKNFMEKLSEVPLAHASDRNSKSDASVENIIGEFENNPLIKILTQTMPEENRKVIMLMFELMIRGVSPDEYSSFYRFFELAGGLSENNDVINAGAMRQRGSSSVKRYDPAEDASAHTLVLKIQMKGVVKPPMWREVEVPADVDFEYLHEVIQRVMGFDNSHLWRFNASAYDKALLIGLQYDDEFGRGLEYVTDDACETPLTRFLHQKGDKLEYVYDFGDDWIFTVEVKNILDKESDFAVCVKYKSELNPIEDFGGHWSYINARENMEKWDTLSKKEKERCADEYGLDSPKEYYGFIKDNYIDIKEVNAALAGMKKG